MDSEAQIIRTEYSDLMKKSYIDYAMSVIISRALPDVRDGLKPVQRRTLYDMYELGIRYDKPYRKCARIVGDTMGKYHPHGDSSIYEALVVMAQDFKKGQVLVDGHGNFGSIEGDGAAAMRYTEARLTKFTQEVCLSDLDKNVIDFGPNFDETEKEPVVLPVRVPNLLVNGAEGIAVGMATSIPTHNLGEVIDAVKAYMKNDAITTKQLMKYVKGPDFPTGGIVVNKETRLEDTFGVNMLAVTDGRPETLGLKKIIEHHVDFQFELATRKYTTLLAKEKEKSEVQEGLIKACDVIDLIIEILRGSKSVKDARACLVNGVTDNIRFKSSISKKMAAMLRFTERQATAILEMRLYRLIGLEIEALQKEHEETLKNIARYEDILNNYDSMAGVIMEELDHYKKEYGRKRRTQIENAEEAVFEEKKIEEQDAVFLMDRFGYAKTVDVSVYERNREAADSENRYVVHCLNTGRLCLFTDTGKMHQVKVLDLPHGKFRDKGTPIDNVSNYSSSGEQIVMVCDSEQMRFSYLLFATAQGMIKRVEGTEFQVTKRTIAATKLQEGDTLIDVKVITENQNVVLRTRNGYFLRFPASDVPVKKKAAVGVRGIRLQKKDELEQVYLFEEGTETKAAYGEREVTLNRLKLAKRDGTGTRAR